jgi:hypothetical protein
LQKGFDFLLHSGLAPISLWKSGKWPEGGTLNYNAILQLDLFCKTDGKWTEIPYVQLFFFPNE